MQDGIPAAMFRVDDLAAEYRRLLNVGVAFRGEPLDAGKCRVAVFDDNCGNFRDRFPARSVHRPAEVW